MAFDLRSELLLFALVLLVRSTTLCRGDSSVCLTAYKVGGPQAVFQSPECPHRMLADYDFSVGTENPRCQISMLQGRQDYQEDRALCALDLIVPFPAGEMGTKEVTVDIAAVFDGHNGPEASDMASKLFLDYFSFHTHFLSDEARSAVSSARSGDSSHHLKILKEALIRAVRDIDETFSKEAQKREFISGATASIALMVDEQILLAKVGNARAFLCSEKSLLQKELARATLLRLRRDGGVSPSRENNLNSATSKGFVLKELTKADQPDKDDEKIQAESAGDYVLDWAGVPRLEGQLTHSIGDVSYKSFGAMSTPETTDWQPLTAKDRYPVAVSDGVLEKMSLQDVCDVLRDEQSNSDEISLAGHIVDIAFKKGSMDNLSAVVIPLEGSSRPKREQNRDGRVSRRYEL